MVRPSRRGKNRALLTGEVGTGTPSGDDVSWDAGPFTPPSGSSLTVEESDASPSVSPVDTLIFDATDFTVTDNTGGNVTVTADEPDAAAHIADATDAHDASAISIVDTGGYFTGTDVEAALQELGAGGGGGGGADWSLDLNESGTSFANFTAATGTWSSNGTEIIQTGTTAAFHQARHNTKIGIGYPTIVEVEAWFHSAGQGGGGFNYVAVLIGMDNAGTGGPIGILLDRANGLMRWQTFGSTDYRTVATTVNADTWYKIRIVANGNRVTGYKDGTLIGTAVVTQTLIIADYVGIGSYASTVKFRNFKAWTLTTGAP